MSDVQLDAVLRRWQADHHAWFNGLSRGNTTELFGESMPREFAPLGAVVTGMRLTTGVMPDMAAGIEDRTPNHMIVGAYVLLASVLDLLDLWGVRPSEMAEIAREVMDRMAEHE